MLSRYENEGVELVIDNETGEAFATQSGYVSMSGKAKSTISERLQGVRDGDIKTAELQTPGGLQGVRLIPAKLVFKWLLKDNPELAEKMGEAGATQFLYQVAGYKVKVVEEKPKTVIELFEYHLAIAKEHESRLIALEAENALLKEQQADNERRLDGVEAEVERFNYPMGRYFTVMGYAAFLGKKIQLKQAGSLGTKASKVCRGLDIVPEKVKDVRFGYVGSYPEQVLAELFEDEIG